ncbi:hypothetical protein [uncultured Microbacterium sp.]|uniref:hypothetical protein n=1 Tax=uncultured Microbacterium sp. TaxID=191216 RepID=UPI0028D19A39|nr:hypothetical protein [uncultured Microbacterium sp.]
MNTHPIVPVGLIVNVYERTYRDVLRPGFFAGISDQNRVRFAETFALINNVADLVDATARADALVSSGELTGFRIVAADVDRALRVAHLPRRVLRDRGYFLDYGLVMSVTGSSQFVLGWDAETQLAEDFDWVSPAVNLLNSEPRVFSAAPRWPLDRDTLDEESFARRGSWSLNYGFSDQVFLVRRADIAGPIYRSFAPAAWARHASHPNTFEARLEAHQRAAQTPRATHLRASYRTNDLDPVIPRTGGYTAYEVLRRKACSFVRHVLKRVHIHHPRFRLP